MYLTKKNYIAKNAKQNELLYLNERIVFRKNVSRWIAYIMGKYVHITNINDFPFTHNHLFHKADSTIIEQLTEQQQKFALTQLQTLYLRMNMFGKQYSSKISYNKVAALSV